MFKHIKLYLRIYIIEKVFPPQNAFFKNNIVLNL